MLFVSWPSPPEQEREISAESESKVTIFHFIHGIIFCVPNLLGFEAQKFVLGMKNLSSSIFFYFANCIAFPFLQTIFFWKSERRRFSFDRWRREKFPNNNKDENPTKLRRRLLFFGIIFNSLSNGNKMEERTIKIDNANWIWKLIH